MQLRGTHTDVDRPQSIGPGPIVSTGSQSTDQFFDLGRPQSLRAVALIGAGSESIRAPNRWGPWSHRLAGRIDSGGLALSRAAQSIRPASRRPERPRHCDRWSRRRGRAQSIRRAPIDGASRINTSAARNTESHKKNTQISLKSERVRHVRWETKTSEERERGGGGGGGRVRRRGGVGEREPRTKNARRSRTTTARGARLLRA